MKYQVKDYYVKEIADYYGISAQTVRLYDKKGLLPSDKNELNGYRIYTREDIVTMDYICRLKKMHFSLEDIRKIMNEEPLEEAERMFVKQEAKLAAEVKELQRLIGNMRILSHYLHQKSKRDGNFRGKNKRNYKVHGNLFDCTVNCHRNRTCYAGNRYRHSVRVVPPVGNRLRIVRADGFQHGSQCIKP